MMVQLPVRLTGYLVQNFAYTTLRPNSEKPAFLPIICEGDCGLPCNLFVESHITSALFIYRAIGVRTFYQYKLVLAELTSRHG